MKVKDYFILVAVLCLAIIASSIIIADDVVKSDCDENENECLKKVHDIAKIPDVGSLKCLLTEYNRCPKFDGSYKQCTNNYIPTPQYGNCPCHNRTFEMCPQKWKVAENVYEEGAAACEPEKVDTYNPENVSNKSRVNWWRYNDKVPDSYLVQCKGSCKVLY